MLPDAPFLRCHPKTKELFWTHECEVNPKTKWWQWVSFARDLTLHDYQRALASGVASSPEKECYIRTRYWWVANGPVRHGKRNVSMPSDYRQNLTKLRSLLDVSVPDDRIMAAEIARELGNMDEASELLSAPLPPDYAKVVEQLRAWISAGDSQVRQLSEVRPPVIQIRRTEERDGRKE